MQNEDSPSERPRADRSVTDRDDASSSMGGPKPDPISASPTTGETIAGRSINTGGVSDLSNPSQSGRGAGSATEGHAGDEPATGGPDTDAKGVTGTQGQDDASAHRGPERAAGRDEQQA